MPPYLPHTPEDVQAMLARIGRPSLDTLFEDIPEEVRLRRPLHLDTSLTEMQLSERLESLAARFLFGCRRL